MCYLIGLDIGTSSVKGVLMTYTGGIKKTAHKSFEYKKFENGGVQISAEDFLNSCYSAIKELSEGEKVIGLCAASASGNLLILDKNNKPMTPIFGWQDRRVTYEAEEVMGKMDNDALYDMIGWPFSYKTLPPAQLCCIKKHEPEILKTCGRVCMSTEYLYYRLTNEWGIGTSGGTPFCLIDQKKGKYIPELLEKLGIDEAKLPPVKKTGTVLEKANGDAARLCGLDKDTAVVLGSFDHPSAARGAGVLSEGDMLLSLGTSWVAFLPVNSREKIVKAKALIDPFLSPGGAWGAMVSAASLSERIAFYTSRFIDASSRAFEILGDLAEKSEKGAGGLRIELYEKPDDEIVLKYSKEDIARAIMEGTVRLLKEKIDKLKEFGISADSAKVVGGPSEGKMWIKIIEEMLGIPVSVVHGAQTGAVGAAILAGIGTGVYENEFQAIEIIKKD